MGLWSVYDRGWRTGTYLQVGKGPSSVFIPVLGPSRAQIWCRADVQVCQLDIPGLFVVHISGSQRPCLDCSPSCQSSYRWGAGRRVSLGSFGTLLSLIPLLPQKRKKKHKEKKEGGRACFVYLFFDILSITLVVSGPPIDGMVCLSKCRNIVF